MKTLAQILDEFRAAPVRQLVSSAMPPAVIAFGRIAREPRAMVAGPIWRCPICEHNGRFLTYRKRRWSLCWHCGSTERHRLLWHVIKKMTLPEPILHFAPERGIKACLRARYHDYQTADICKPFPVDHPGCDLANMPFPDASFGTVIACHVLEHVHNDGKAIAGIARILRPGGLAIVPVPIVSATTVEFDVPVTEHDHVRAPGLDYYDRLMPFFSVRVITSSNAPDRIQTWLYEDRTEWPSAEMPGVAAMLGERHPETIPIAIRTS